MQGILGATRAADGDRNAQIIALMTAMQESTFRDIRFGDRESRGLFQQRPSQGWCSGGMACVNPTYAADRVQRSCCPTAYAQSEWMATTLTDTY